MKTATSAAPAWNESKAPTKNEREKMSLKKKSSTHTLICHHGYLSLNLYNPSRRLASFSLLSAHLTFSPFIWIFLSSYKCALFLWNYQKFPLILRSMHKQCRGRRSRRKKSRTISNKERMTWMCAALSKMANIIVFSTCSFFCSCCSYISTTTRKKNEAEEEIFSFRLLPLKRECIVP